MRKIVLDYDLTIICPLFLFALIALWHSIRAYRQFLPTRKEKWNAQRLIYISSVVLIGLCVLLLVPDAWKTVVAYQFWYVLFLVGGASFLITIGAAWHYANKAEWLKLGVCVLVALIVLAGEEHFFHQKINASHVTCPQCSDDGSNDN